MLVYYKTCQFMINGKLKSSVVIFICGRALLFFFLFMFEGLFL